MTEPETPAEPTAEPEVPEPQQPPEGEPKTFDADYVDKLRKEAARYRTEAKANAEASKRLKELEDSQKSETEKLNERLTVAERRALDADRLEIALEKGLSKSQAKRLVGSTREELEADAEELLADLGQQTRPGEAVPRKPAERLRGGTNPEEPVLEMDPHKLAAAVPRNTF